MWSIPVKRVVRRGRIRPQAIVRAGPKRSVTCMSAHSNASVSSNSVSPRAVRQSKKSFRKCDATANASRRTS